MHAFRLRACSLTIIMVLALSACGSASISEVPEVRISHTVNINATSTVHPKGKMVPASNPVRMIIPAIAINAPVEEVGTQANADLGTPTQNPWQDVGWYSLGPQPGERGSAVIDGHLDRPGGFSAVFWHLRDVHVGDEVLIKICSWKLLRFEVYRFERYVQQYAPFQLVYGSGG